MKIYLVCKAERFQFLQTFQPYMLPVRVDSSESEWERFNEFLDSHNFLDIEQIIFSSDLSGCVVIYKSEVKYIDRKEYDINLPETNQPPNPEIK